MGNAAGVKVNTDPKTGKVRYASLYDFRRSFGERWAARVMPNVLTQPAYAARIDRDHAAVLRRPERRSNCRRPLGGPSTGTR